MHEPGFTEFPVEVEVFGEEHGGDHAEAVVHESGGGEFAHSGIDEWESCAALFPCVEGFAGLVPWESAPVGVEFLFEDVGEVVEDGEVEFAPGEFLDEDVDAGFSRSVGFGAGFEGVGVDGADGDEAVA